MLQPAEPWSGWIIQRLIFWWGKNHSIVMRLAVLIMGVASALWLGYQFWRLICASTPIWPASPVGAVDLELRYKEVQKWFLGKPIYAEDLNAVYPPATLAILWPFLGWLPFNAIRYLAAFLYILALTWTIIYLLRESGAETHLERALVGLLPLSLYATGAEIGNGQLLLLIMPFILAALQLLRSKESSWGRDLIAGTCLVVALVKPTVSVPFLWLAIIIPRSIRPIAITIVEYAVLTFVSVSFQEHGVVYLFQQWLLRGTRLLTTIGTAHIYILLTHLGLQSWNLPVSAVLLLGLGWWIHSHRKADYWLLLGVTAIFARVWMYHQWYDDLLILIPAIALFRMAKQKKETGVVAGIYLALTIGSLIAPGGLFLLPAPLKNIYLVGQIAVWLIVLFALMKWSREETMIEQVT